MRRRIEDVVWNPEVDPDSYSNDGKDRYQAAILEQYKLYVEMADRVSQRRGITNTFFLTLNTAIFTLFGVFWKDRPGTSEWWLVLPLAVALLQCASWHWLVRSYRQLNSAKFAVIGALERRLPARAYSDAEWGALGKGRDWRLYLPLTHLEQWVPLLFAALYVGAFLLVILS